MAADSIVIGSSAQQPVEERRRRKRRGLLLALLLGSALALASLAVLAAYYALTRQPVTDLPGVQQVTQTLAPRRVFSFVGPVRPVGVAVSPDGQRIFVAEGGGERLIKVFDREGREVARLAPPNTKPGTRKPSHMATDAGGSLYVVDRLRAGVDVYNPTGEWERAWHSPAIEARGGWLPNGVSVASDGRLLVADIGRQEHAVLSFSADGSLLEILSQSSGIPGGLNYPTQAVADDAGRVYIGDASNGRLLAVGPNGVKMAGIAGNEALTLPISVAISGQRLFVADAAAHRIAVFAIGDQPRYLHSFGDTDDDEGLAYPHAVAADRAGRIYVADRVNDRVQVWTY